MTVSLPEPKKCPKCSGIMHWVIFTTTPASQKPPQFVGYSCSGGGKSSPPTVGGCGYKEEHQKST